MGSDEQVVRTDSLPRGLQAASHPPVGGGRVKIEGETLDLFDEDVDVGVVRLRVPASIRPVAKLGHDHRAETEIAWGRDLNPFHEVRVPPA